MSEIECPFPDCSYTTGNVEASVAVELLKIHGLSHAAPQNAAKVDKVSRPSISSGISAADWNYFETRWTEYVEATNIKGKTLIIQLLECCDEQLRRDLTRDTVGALTSKTEKDLIEGMKKLAVREENPMVARVELHSMVQGHDEAVRVFGARVRGQANVCKYIIKCKNCAHDVDYTDHIIQDVITQGLADKDIQLDLLGSDNQTPTLEETFKFIEKKESGKRSATRLSHNISVQAAAAKSSSYHKQKRENIKSIDTPTLQRSKDTCTYCGEAGHGRKASFKVRQTSCPAFNHVCGKCNIKNHVESLCRSEKRAEGKEEAANAADHTTVSNLCSIQNEVQCNYSVNLDHHVHDNLTDTWQKRPSMSQPVIKLSISINAEDYKAIVGHPHSIHNCTKVIECIADTGCQSCLAGLGAMSQLGICKEHLLPVNMAMKAANNVNINIIGAVIVRLSEPQNRGTSTKQIIYITDSTNKFFLSREACLALGIISKQFPIVGEHSASVQTIDQPCDC